MNTHTMSRGWIPMWDGVHAFIISARVEYDRGQEVFCMDCECLTLPISAITKNADGSVPVQSSRRAHPVPVLDPSHP